MDSKLDGREKYGAFQSLINKLEPKGLNTSFSPFVPDSAGAWDRSRVSHLLRRTGYGAHIDRINEILALSPSQAVDQIIQSAISAPLPTTPEWIDATPPNPFNGQYATANQQRMKEYRISWIIEMRKAPFRERFAFFWRNHFVVSSSNDIFAPLWHRYMTVIRRNTFGNFKTFAKEIGLDHAMLIFLDGRLNASSNDKVQENYAREFLELFMMGIKNKAGQLNYTQNDITELAKAFSGYSVDFSDFSVNFNPQNFYDETKTILGRTGNFDYNQAIDIVFEERNEEIAYFICGKIYRYFVYEGINDTIVQEMADIFISSDFEILPVVETLLKSEHFFDREFIGAKIKSPLEFLNSLYVETGVEPDQSLNENHELWLNDLEQDPYSAPNVAGWPGYHLWLSNTTVISRWDIARNTLRHQSSLYEVDIVSLSKEIAGVEANNPDLLARLLSEYFLSVPLPENEIEDFSERLLDGVPDYDWNVDEPGADEHIFQFVEMLRELPEYNLF